MPLDVYTLSIYKLRKLSKEEVFVAFLYVK